MALIEFSPQEADVAVALFDIAVRSQGLAVSENALALTKKVRAAFAPPPSPPPSDTPPN